MQHADQVFAGFEQKYGGAAKMFKTAFFAMASRQGMEIARQAEKDGNPEQAHKGLGIACLFGEARGEPIETITEGKVELRRFGINCAGTSLEEYRRLSDFSQSTPKVA